MPSGGNGKAMIVIIGCSIAAEKAVSELYKDNAKSAVTVIRGESFSPYPRPRLPEAIAGTLDLSFFKSPSKLAKYEENGLKVIDGIASSINIKEKAVSLEDGRIIRYDDLIIATGSRARESGYADYPLRSIDDAEKIISAASGKKDIAVLGAGILGLELAFALKQRSGSRITVIESANRVMPRQLDEVSSAFFEKKLSESGLDIICGESIDSYEDGVIRFKSGKETGCGLLLESIGVIPNSEIASASGIRTERAVIIDDHARTSEGHVYAIGDVASYNGLCPGLVYFALETARVAAANILGNESTIKLSPPSLMINLPGIPGYSIGCISSPIVIRNEDGPAMESFFISSSGILEGSISIGSKAKMMKVMKNLGKEFNASEFQID